MAKIIFILLALLNVTAFSELYAQDAIVTSGGVASGSNGSIDFSVGQVFYSTSFGTNGSLSAGIQQPYEISIINSIDENLGIILECLAYPNPTSNNLTLSIEKFNTKHLSYLLFDTSGKLIEQQDIQTSNTLIKMTHLVPSVYFLKVTDGKTVIKTFKIIKN